MIGLGEHEPTYKLYTNNQDSRYIYVDFYAGYVLVISFVHGRVSPAADLVSFHDLREWIVDKLNKGAVISAPHKSMDDVLRELEIKVQEMYVLE